MNYVIEVAVRGKWELQASYQVGVLNYDILPV